MKNRGFLAVSLLAVLCIIAMAGADSAQAAVEKERREADYFSKDAMMP